MALLLNGRNKYLDPSLDYNTYADALSPAGTSQENPGLMFREPQRHAFPVAPPSVESAESPTVPHPDDIARYDAFTPSGPAAAPDIERDVLTPQINKAQADYSAALHAPRAKMWRQILGGFVGARNPMLGGVISGELGRQRNIEAAGSDYSMALNALQQQRQAEMFGLQKQNIQSEVASRQAGVASEMAMMPLRMKMLEAQAESANLKDVDGILYDMRTKQPVIGGQATLTKDEAEALGGSFKEGQTVGMKTKEAGAKLAQEGVTTVTGEHDQYMFKKSTGQLTPLHIGSPRALNAPEQQIVPVVVDPTKPGVITFAKKGEAMAKGYQSPEGAATTAAKTEARSEVPKNIGDQKVAFNTMIAHAALLRKAAAALHNGNIQILNGMKNDWRNAFGYSGPITAEAIADAYKGEVSNVINKGHITDTGNEKVAHTLDPTRQNYETLDSVLGAYQALAQSKLDQLGKQAQASRTGNFAATDQVGGAQTIEYKIVNGKLVPKGPGE